ncbi:TPA: pyridoxal phosphate-dependent aminotransferase [Streptococcus agalactiae]|nr:pyridoxal phosphate-dependent aminotransferase [Streptococcus agalactiae]
MITYDFTSLPERFSSNTIKWKAVQKDQEILPLWIADMDFPIFPEMSEAIEDFSHQMVFGYDSPKDSLYQVISNWEVQEHGYQFDKKSLLLIDGVVPAISVAIQAFTKEGDAVLINTPVYPPFARTIKYNNRHLVSNSLLNNNQYFEIDFKQLEKDIIENNVKLYIFCSPHNPGGRVWTKGEIQKIGDICKRYNVILVSDEIHQDLVLFDNVHHSFNTVDSSFKELSVILSSATKTFNIAGTKNSFAIIENEKLRSDFKKRQIANNQQEISSLGLLATEVAFTKEKQWLKALKMELEGSIEYLYEQLTQKTHIKVMKPEGTYLVWLDFSAYNLTHLEIQEKLRYDAKLILNDGLTFGKEGKKHARINVAAPRSVIEEAVLRLVTNFRKND